MFARRRGGMIVEYSLIVLVIVAIALYTIGTHSMVRAMLAKVVVLPDNTQKVEATLPPIPDPEPEILYTPTDP